VTDDGRGFDPTTAMRVGPGHLGLVSMRERLEMAGGVLSVESQDRVGSTVTICTPTHAQSTA
jgi:signal transduction histidine kinase